jgi:hypothetical protein
MLQSNDKLEEIAFKVDDIITVLIEDYKLDPVSASTIVLARIILINDFIGTGERFRNLITNIPNMRLENEDTTGRMVH